MTIIHVVHAGADYQVVVGPLAQAMPRLSGISGGQRLPVISDQRVYSLYGHWLAEVALGEPLLVPEGEAAKNWQTLAEIIDRLAALDVKRGTPLVALGGGSVGDLGGLAASLFKRGSPIVHIPTTLLAQADSAIGGKTAVNCAGQKNLAGTFHHPLLVIADPALLDTVDDRQLRAGYAEVVKYGLIDDPGFYSWCEANAAALIGGDLELRHEAVRRCVLAKTRFISADPDDTGGTRALLNFGHTFAHAIEAVSGGRILHGEAVAAGMTLAMRLSARLGMCPGADAERVATHLESVRLPTELRQLSLGGQADELCRLMTRDKKADQSGMVLVLADGIGRAKLVKGISAGELSRFLHEAA